MTQTTIEGFDEKLEELARGEASRALECRTIRFELQDNNVVPVLDTSDSIAGDAARITDCVKEIIDSNDVLFELVQRRYVLGIAEYLPSLMIKATTMGEEFLRCLRTDVDRITDLYSIEDFNPYFRLFRQAAMRDVVDRNAVYVDGLSDRVLGDYARRQTVLVDGELEDFFDRLGNAVEMIRRVGRSSSFKQEIWTFEKPAKENYDSLVSLIRANFAACHHLLVLRVDLGYAQYYCDPEVAAQIRTAG